MEDADAILEQLVQRPRDWDARILAVENAARSGDLDEARRLVRECPSDVETPPEIQVRIHALLSQCSAASTEISGPSIEPCEPEPEAGDHHGGGLVALIEDDSFEVQPTDAPEGDGETGSRSRAPVLQRNAVRGRWDDYDGGLQLVDANRAPKPERPSHTPERLSSLALALVVHLIVFILVGLVAVQVPYPKPPQIVVSALHEREADLVTPRVTRPTPEIKPAAAAAQAIDVISSVENSTYSVPDVEDAANLIVASTLPGVQPLGDGMSFSTDATQVSDINFFGISGSGKKIVFVIDATPAMLVDEKGGMTAYDNVKEEVGIMLANLNRGTHFNILLYQGKRLVAFRENLVPGLPSNLRLAIDWLDPLNRDYEALGLGNGYGESIDVGDHETFPIQAVDVAHYGKAVQKALEWHASTVFCIASGYQSMRRSPTPEMREEMKARMKENPGTPGTINSTEQKVWQNAVAKTRAWLQKENAARREKGISPKVVVNFNQLVQQRTGARPPQRRGGTPAGGGMPPLPPIRPKDIEEQIKRVVEVEYKEDGLDELDDPSIHMVLFLGEDERIREQEDHFRRLAGRNGGKLKVLRGLAALDDVTGTK
ncbi:MAG: hypothetical protein WD342_03865 [Verrucomicrobiales bacterium]